MQGVANDTGMTRRPRILATALWPIAALVGALAIAIGGAFVTGSEVGAVTEGVESLSSSSSSFLSRVGDWFPLGFAFSAGMVSSVNPCGFVMLPAYLGLYMGDSTGGSKAGTPLGTRLQRAVLVGSTVTAGFVLMFAIVGMPIGLGARGIAGAFPWIGLAIGVLLVGAGAYLLSGGKIYTSLAMRLSARFGGDKGVRGYFMFGIGYGLASLSCTLPIFLAVIGGTFTADTFLDSLLQFALYGLGMGFVIMALTLSMALFDGTNPGRMLGRFVGRLLRRSTVLGIDVLVDSESAAGWSAQRLLRRVLPHVNSISAGLLLVSGAFIVYYWLTIGNLLERIQDAL